MKVTHTQKKNYSFSFHHFSREVRFLEKQRLIMVSNSRKAIKITPAVISGDDHNINELLNKILSATYSSEHRTYTITKSPPPITDAPALKPKKMNRSAKDSKRAKNITTLTKSTNSDSSNKETPTLPE